MLKNTKGIDVSHHQGEIDWKKVKADGVKFAVIRAKCLDCCGTSCMQIK